MNKFSVKQITVGATTAVLAIFLLIFSGKMFEDVDAGEILVVQDWYDGELHVYTSPGMKVQMGGTCTKYKKSFQYWFDGADEDDHFALIPTKFYDGGHAGIPGSARIDLPLDANSLTKIHTKFGSQDAVEVQLIGQTLIKSISMSGPLMSSKESYAEKKNNLVYYIEDQAANGIYKTTQKDIKTLDPLTNSEKVITVVEIINDSKNMPLRQERSLLKDLNIQLSNLSLGDFQYDDVVKKQIAAQQQSIMQVQQGIANAKRAEQDAITVEQQGKADAAKAKWEQEVIKAQMVTEAQQRLEVAKLNKETEEQNKQALTLKGEGEANYKRAVTLANNNFDKKADIWLKSQELMWDAFAKYTGNMVPTTIMGGAGNSTTAMDFMQIMTAKSLKDLSLDVSK